MLATPPVWLCAASATWTREKITRFTMKLQARITHGISRIAHGMTR